MATQYPTTDHTRGTTFSRATLACLPAGSWAAASIVLDKNGALVQLLDVAFEALPTPDAQGNTHALSVLATGAQTQAWPLGPLMWVTRYTDNSPAPVVLPAVSRVIQCNAYTVPQRPGDDPLAVIPDSMAQVLRAPPAEGSDITIDPTPTDGSTNAVSSNGVFDALAGKSDSSHNHAGTYDPAGTAATAVSNHASATDPHGDRAFASAADTTVLNTAKSYADSLVVGLVDDRGNYNASGNTFPASGGSGTAGAVLKGDLWTVSVGGTLGGVAVTAGDLVRALVDAPGQTAGNWAVTENNIGYVAENAANKDARGGFAGLTLFKLNLKNALGTVTSWFTTAATAARTWTLPDKDGTVAMTSDITGTNSGTNTGDETGARVAALHHAATAKTTLVDADEITGQDSAASFGLIRATLANLWVYIKSKADTTYFALSGGTLAGGTVTASSPVLTVTQTWNSAGTTFTGKVTNITDTASAAESKIEDWQVGGVTKAWLRKDGRVVSTSSFFIDNGGYAGFSIAGNAISFFPLGGNANYFLDINTLDQRNGTAAQTSRLYGTYTDGSNGRWLEFAMSTAGAAVIKATGNGTGASGNTLQLNRPIAAGFGAAIATKTGNYTATLDDDTILVDATSGAITITLPAASTATNKVLTVKKIDSSANTVTVAPNAAETIDGATTMVLSAPWAPHRAQCDGTAWFALSYF